MYDNLTGKKAVIIGASSGIGLALTQQLANLGATVVMASRSEEKLARAKEKITGKVEIKAVNILDETSVENLFSEVGNFDHMVVTAVADENLLRSPIAKMSTETAQRGFEKFWGSFNAVRAAVPHIQPSGSITLTSSVAIFNPSREGGLSVMSAASGAVAVFGRSLAAELAPIRVNVVAPGVVNSGVWDKSSPEERSNLLDWAKKSLPVAHLGEPNELAHAITYLITNPYTTGTILTVDGGLSVI